MSDRKKTGLLTWIGIGAGSVLVPIGCHFAAYYIVADVIVMGGGIFGGYSQAAVIYRLGDHELGSWAESFFAPAAYADRKALRRSRWYEDEQPPPGYVSPASLINPRSPNSNMGEGSF